MKKILLIGSTCVDVIIEIDHLPRTAEDIQPKRQTLALGGCAYNAANIVRQSGVPYTFITPIGTGVYGDYIRKSFIERQLPIHVNADSENGCCYCLVDANGERTFLSVHGAEYTFHQEWMENIDLSEISMIYVCGLEIEEATGDKLISWLEEHRGPQLFFAPGPRVRQIGAEKMKRLYQLKPILHINEEEAFELSYLICSDFHPDVDFSAVSLLDAARTIQSSTHNTVIITKGGKGSCCLEAGKNTLTEVLGIKANIVDTIGAGDSHIGQVMASRMMGCSWREALSQANKVSAKVVSVKGAGLTDTDYEECLKCSVSSQSFPR